MVSDLAKMGGSDLSTSKRSPCIDSRLNEQITFGLPCLKRKRHEVFENVKYITVTSRAPKLPVFKVWQLQDLNPEVPCEQFFIC